MSYPFATIVVLAMISRDASFIRVNMPASLDTPFHPGVLSGAWAALPGIARQGATRDGGRLPAASFLTLPEGASG